MAFLSKYSAKQRFYLALLWSFLTIVTCYAFLAILVLIFGFETIIYPNEYLELIYVDIYTFIPAIMVLIFIFKFKTSYWDESGLSSLPNNILWLFFGLFYTVIVLIPTLIIDGIFNLITLDNTYTPWVGDNSSLSVGNTYLDIFSFVTLGSLLLLFSPGGFIRVFGEEYGWRGYLLPELVKSHKYIPLVGGFCLVGFVWTLFHIPFFTILSPQKLSSEEMIFSLLGSIGVFFGASFTLAWAYLKTHSIWPALSLHFIWNIINPLITGNVYSNETGLFKGPLWLMNGEGLIGGFFHFLVGLFFLYLIIKNKNSLLKEHLEFLEAKKRQKLKSGNALLNQTPVKSTSNKNNFYRKKNFR